MLTRKLAIEQAQQLWNAVDLSGLSKDEYLETTSGRKWTRNKYACNCPLCEFVEQTGRRTESRCIKYCPLYIQYGKGCQKLGQKDDTPPSKEWLDSIRNLTR
jgi:hypothetical protein